ncbi:hypothetical protein ADH76_11165 [Enterocloster clostridioformis]|uniref:Ig-like domain-containing protein n=1 Tax=Enterocloster clostridioformis TaxID=1531 RepID=UPI00080CA802|nr:hypothetical protein [Enterocloster clostridioformis]ANU48324.1 hypothetical protein A4V08_23445 [Lachnoclostridium sp. YL32]NDO29430.1 hypothetical protein [Enterocloster clostridioformis]OXE68970.1 hypothetical protein ADH76_11165 [Enterocloster clostridioformis]QQR02789.1 hypothetical protein I5Q83_11365 [Enterocloster clostridioformis]
MDKRIKKGSAVLTVWTLIAVLGASPAGAAFPSYASVMERSYQEIHAASSSEARRTPETIDTDREEDYGGELGKEQPAEETVKEETPNTEGMGEEEQETEEPKAKEPEVEDEELQEEIRTATPSEAVPKEEELQNGKEFMEATPSNALKMTGDLWGGIEMSDHFDGEGTEEEPYQLRNDKDLKLLAYQVANEEVDGYDGCYFELTKDISLNDSASWLPIGYYRSLSDSEPYPFKGTVEGKVGSSSADYIGGPIGRMQSGRVKNGRFAGTIGASTSSALKTAGLFIGVIEGGNVELGDHLEYLYTNSEDKYALNPFGNKLTPQIRLEHHIGAYYSNNRDFSLYQMGSFVKQTSRFFYEELEDGVLAIGDSNIHHFAASKTGDPVRGYAVSVPAIDYGTLSVMESQNNYAKEINWAPPGAIAAGTKVLVYTSPTNDTESDPPVYYELEPGSLTWVSDDSGKHEDINSETADIFFTMPDENITVSVKYRAMTNGVILSQDNLTFEVEQIRSGSHLNPQIAWKITDPQHLTATVIPDSAANKNVVWNVKDTDGSSTDVISVDNKGTVTVNQEAKWIQDLIKAGVTNQEIYPSKPITTEGKNYTSVTVTTEAGQKRASCLVTVNFKIRDETTVPVSNITLKQSEISFDVVRVLAGNRLEPQVAYRVTPSQRLYETITPEYADNKAVSWKAGDENMVTVDWDGLASVNNQARWIEDLVNVDVENLKQNSYAASIAGGSRSTYVTATTVDGGKQAVCAVNINFSTEDHTVVHVDGVRLDKKNLTVSIEKIMEGDRLNPSVRYEVTPPQKLNAVVTPDQADNKKIFWETNDGSVLTADQGGSVEVNQEAAWIQELKANDAAKLKEDRYALSTASGSKKGLCDCDNGGRTA